MPHDIPAEDREVKRLRKAQAKAVMPLIGHLLDVVEQMPNDVKGYEELEELLAAVQAIDDAMENAE